jgi:hypothetical protein
MRSSRVCLLVVVFACIVALTPAVLLSQTSNAGTVSGTVIDASGAAVPAVSVTLTDTSTKTARSTTTNEAGRYAFIDVPPGIYNLAMSKSGFRTAKFANVTVIVGTPLTLNTTMEVGSLTETVEVVAGVVAELQTSNATMGSTVTGDMLLMAPSLDRDASSILTFQPATAPANSGGDIYGGQVAGSMSDQNTYMLDGGNITSLNMVTKRGTDAFHGSAYEFFQAQFLNANTWDNNRFGEPIVKFHDNRFGGSVGGPMLPGRHLGGRTYFYAFYEGHRYPGQASVLE